MSLSRPRTLPAGFIAPCLPTDASQPPSGEQWLHEIKHDGFRVIASKDGNRVRLYSRLGNDLTYRFRLISEALARLQVRKATLASVIGRAGSGLRFNEHMEETDGLLVFQHACKLGLEGIVSKRRDSRYRSGRSPDWIKSKNPNAPAVRREAEEDWR